MKTIYFVRHGESEANIKDLHQGPNDPLTEVGIAQGQRIADRVNALPVEAFISSPQVRTRQTAEIIASKTGKQPEFVDLFVEMMGPREFFGVPRSDTKASEAFREINGKYGMPGWRFAEEENFDDHTVRAQECFKYLAARPEKHILVVTHGLFLRVLVAHLLFDMRPTAKEITQIRARLINQNTGITIFLYDDTKKYPWSLSVYNDHAHLG